MKQGLVYIFTGDGKGKTSAALGTLLRGIGRQWQVAWVSLYKEPQWKLSEFAFLNQLSARSRKKVQMKLMGKGFYIADGQVGGEGEVKVATVNDAVVVDDDSQGAHQQAAHQALTHFAELLSSQHYQLCILDEVCNAIDDGLLSEQAVLAVIAQRGKTHLVLTGRNATSELIKQADLVSRIEKVKHPYDQGQNAVQGLDF